MREKARERGSEREGYRVLGRFKGLLLLLLLWVVGFKCWVGWVVDRSERVRMMVVG